MNFKTFFIALSLIFTSSAWAATSPNGFTLNAASGSTGTITLANWGLGNAELQGNDVNEVGNPVPLYSNVTDLSSQVTGLVNGGANTFQVATSVWDNWESIFIGLKQADGKKSGIGGYAIFELTREILSGTWSTPSGQSGQFGTGLSHYFAFGGELKPPSEVPVPAAVWLFGSAFAGMFGLRRKHAK